MEASGKKSDVSKTWHKHKMAFLERNANSGSVPTGFNIDNSLKFEDANNERLYRDNGNSGQKRTFTVSMWLKRTELGYNRIWGAGVSGNDAMTAYFKDTDNIVWYDYGSSAYRFNYRTNTKFRDTSAWYHLVFAVDTEQGTEANRVKLYVNGVEETSYSTQTEPSQNADTNWNFQGYKDIGSTIGENPQFSGYMSEVYMIDDQQLAPTAFGEFDEDSGIWKPKAYTGTFGSVDTFLNFDNSGSLGADSSGNSNNYTLVNITAADQATDTPTNNFAVLNFNHRNSGTSGFSNNPILTEGATVHTSTLADYWQTSIATIGVTSGKWYFEAKIQDSNTTLVAAGMGDEGDIQDWGINNGYLGAGVSNSYSSGSSAYTHSNIIGIAVDVDNEKIYWAKDNTYINSGNPAGNANGTAFATGNEANGTYFLGVSGYKLSGHAVWQVNFGGYTAMSISSAASDANGYGTFEYAPPSGFYALCSKNLAEYGG